MCADRTGRIAVVVFDLDGTLLDSDAALRRPFVDLGVAPEAVTFGHVLAHECERLGVDVEDYLDRYDVEAAAPFEGVDAVLAALPRWAVCSNKHPVSGRAELVRLDWEPEVALFADSFDGPKRLGPVLDRLGVAADEILFVGDTEHDRRCADDVGSPFALAGWNPRVSPGPEDRVLARPGDVLDLVDRFRT